MLDQIREPTLGAKHTRAGGPAHAPAEDAVDHDEEVFRGVGGDGVAPDVDAAGRGLLRPQSSFLFD